MKHSIFKSLAAICLAICPTIASAQFFDKSEAENFFGLGVRIGLNTSNISEYSKPGDKTDNHSIDSWGLGFNAGIVCDINFRNYLTIQPGFFFESRSNKYSFFNYMTGASDQNGTGYGKTRNYSFKVPILASIRFNPASNIRWSIDFGPYFSFGLGGHDKGSAYTYSYINGIPAIIQTSFDNGYFDSRNKFDIGLKMGTGLQFFNHYYVGIHYEAGLKDPWKEYTGGHNKAWTFTIGYDF